MQRLTMIVRGRVQGVWFRASTKERADALGLVGWVRNLADGSVQALAEGPPEQLDALEAWAHEGPRLARVVDVESQRGPAEGGLEGFVIRR